MIISTVLLLLSLPMRAKSLILAGVKASRLDDISTDWNDLIKVVFNPNNSFVKWNLIDVNIKKIGEIKKEESKKNNI